MQKQNSIQMQEENGMQPVDAQERARVEAGLGFSGKQLVEPWMLGEPSGSIDVNGGVSAEDLTPRRDIYNPPGYAFDWR